MSTPVKIVWKSKEVVVKIEKKIGRNLDRVGVFLQAEIVRSFGSPMAPPPGGAKTPVRGWKQKARVYRQSQHSTPGDPPFVQTGTLRRSITFEREGLHLFVGSSLQPQGGQDYSYAWLLEMGSPLGQLEARPYLRPAVRKNKNEIREMIAER